MSAARARALAIDDDPGVRTLLGSLLERLGYQPITADDGPRGLALFVPGQYDLLVTDLVMPGMNGLEVAATVRRAEASIGILIVTASACDVELERLEALRAVLVSKPFTLEEFRTALARALEIAMPGADAQKAGVGATRGRSVH